MPHQLAPRAARHAATTLGNRLPPTKTLLSVNADSSRPSPMEISAIVPHQRQACFVPLILASSPERRSVETAAAAAAVAAAVAAASVAMV
jgi:hypothetical protein